MSLVRLFDKRKEDMMENMIEIKDVMKAYEDVNVLKGVTLDVKKGEIFALLGSNGAGKTTLIKILATLLPFDSGKAIVSGLDVQKQAKKVREKISLTGQFAAVDEILTGYENLMMIAKLRRISDIQETVDGLLNRFGLIDAANRRVAAYSGGMRRKLDIAMSMIGHPEVVFLDEPTTGLDPEARIEVWNEVKQLSDNGTTVVLTTQYLEEAEQLADTIAILHEGKIITMGSLAELKRMFPPVKVEFIEKQPSLEEIFLAIIRKKEGKENE